MSGLLFVPQHQLERWIEARQADVTADGLRIGDAAPLALEAAFRFLAVQEGDDTLGLRGKVRSEAAIRALGGEALGSSVLVGEVLYEVEPGFLAALPAGMAGSTPAVARAQEPASEGPGARIDAALGRPSEAPRKEAAGGRAR